MEIPFLLTCIAAEALAPKWWQGLVANLEVAVVVAGAAAVKLSG